MSDFKINERLRELRVISGYTQQQVADFLNCSRSTYTYYETGKSMPDVPTTVTLAKIFNISVAELLADETDIHNVADSGYVYARKKNASHIYDLDRDEMSLVGYYRAGNYQTRKKIMEFVKQIDK